MTPNFPYPKGTYVTGKRFGWCLEGHVYKLTSDPKKGHSYESGYMQSAKCLECGKKVSSVDAGWWRNLATVEDAQRVVTILVDEIRDMENYCESS